MPHDCPTSDRSSSPSDSRSSATRPETSIVLTDGRTVHARALRAEDDERLTRFFDRLDDEAVYFRFFSPTRRATATKLELQRLDGRDHVALAALQDGEIVAVARYDRISSTEAEVALEVANAHQGHGIGTWLLQQLAVTAREHGFRTLSAIALPGNASLFRMLVHAGWPLEQHFDSGTVRIRVPIAPSSPDRPTPTNRSSNAHSRG
jgi:GNAT superfamily N-acetyltransferase